MTDRGWIPYVQVLDPDEVAIIAADLAEFDVTDVEAMLQDHPGRADDHDYVIEYLTAAQQFTTLMAGQRRGLVTMIG